MSWTEPKILECFDKRIFLSFPNRFMRKIHQGSRSTRAFPDTFWNVEGIAFLLELKRFGEDLSLAQESTLREYALSRGIGGLLSVDEKHENFVIIFIVNENKREYQIIVTLPINFSGVQFINVFNLHPGIRKMRAQND